MEKPTPAATKAFAAAFPRDPRAERRKMFGMDAAFVNGNLFAGVYEGGVTLRLGPARVEALLDRDGIRPFEPGGRTWPDYAVADAGRFGGTPELASWVLEALEHTAKLPAKSDRKARGTEKPKAAAETTTKPLPKSAGPKTKATSGKRSVAATKAAPSRSPARKGPPPIEPAKGPARKKSAKPARRTTRKGAYAAKHEPSKAPPGTRARPRRAARTPAPTGRGRPRGGA